LILPLELSSLGSRLRGKQYHRLAASGVGCGVGLDASRCVSNEGRRVCAIFHPSVGISSLLIKARRRDITMIKTRVAECRVLSCRRADVAPLSIIGKIYLARSKSTFSSHHVAGAAPNPAASQTVSGTRHGRGAAKTSCGFTASTRGAYVRPFGNDARARFHGGCWDGVATNEMQMRCC